MKSVEMDVIDSQQSPRASPSIEAAVQNEDTEEISLSKKSVICALLGVVITLCGCGIAGFILLSDEKVATDTVLRTKSCFYLTSY